MKYFDINYIGPALLLSFLIIAFFNWEYSSGTKKEDGKIHPVSSFSVFNSSPDLKYRKKRKQIRKSIKDESILETY